MKNTEAKRSEKKNSEVKRSEKKNLRSKNIYAIIFLISETKNWSESS
jgi:hypothetical protein